MTYRAAIAALRRVWGRVNSALKERYLIIGIMSGWFLLILGGFVYYSVVDDSFFNTPRNIVYRHQPKGAILDRHGKTVVNGSGSERRYVLGAAGGSTIGVSHPDIGVEGFIEREYGERIISSKKSKLWYLINQSDEGYALKTTLDRDLQKKVYEALGDNRGAAVVMRLNGEVRASVSSPSYDPNKMTLKYYKMLQTDPKKPLFNRAIDGMYEPGSVWKTVIAILLLEKGYRDKPVMCNGSLKVGNKTIGCMHKHGLVKTMAEAYSVSCNVWWMKTTLAELDVETMRKGFGRFMTRPIKKDFSEDDFALAAIGQGEVLTSPMELAQLVATIGNEGMKPEMRFVKEDLKAVRVMNKSIAKTMRDMMARVVKNGTAKELAGLTKKGYCVAKTGTSERDTPKGKVNTALLIGLAGRKNKPEIAFSIVIEDAKGTGGSVAVPIMKEILEYYLTKVKD